MNVLVVGISDMKSSRLSALQAALLATNVPVGDVGEKPPEPQTFVLQPLPKFDTFALDRREPHPWNARSKKRNKF